MNTPLTWLNLMHNKARTIVAIAGVAFAVVLILMQLGFLGSVWTTATMIYDQLDFDIVMVSRDYQHFASPSYFPHARLPLARRVHGVARVTPVYIGFNLWRNPDTQLRWPMLVIGADPHAKVFRNDQQIPVERLVQQNTVIVDTLSREEFGSIAVGQERQLGSRLVTIAGQMTMGAGFTADGTVLTSDRTFANLFHGAAPGRVNMALIKLEPNQNIEQVKQQIAALLPPDAMVLTRAEIGWQEQKRWVLKTQVGVIFGFGVLVAFVVGTAIVYQVLSSDIMNRIREYATLKAIGYDNVYCSLSVMKQATVLAVVGYIPGMLIALGLYEVTRYYAMIPIGMTATRGVSVLVASVVMCAVSGFAALSKLHAADPADLF